MAARRVGAIGIGVAFVAVFVALVDVSTSGAVSAESFLAGTLEKGHSVGTVGVAVTSGGAEQTLVQIGAVIATILAIAFFAHATVTAD